MAVKMTCSVIVWEQDAWDALYLCHLKWTKAFSCVTVSVLKEANKTDYDNDMNVCFFPSRFEEKWNCIGAYLHIGSAVGSVSYMRDQHVTYRYSQCVA